MSMEVIIFNFLELPPKYKPALPENKKIVLKHNISIEMLI